MEESSIAAFDLLIPGPTSAFDMLTDPFLLGNRIWVFLSYLKKKKKKKVKHLSVTAPELPQSPTRRHTLTELSEHSVGHKAAFFRGNFKNKLTKMFYHRINFFLFFFPFRAAYMAYGSSGSSGVRGQIRTAATGLCHSHSNARSELHPQPIRSLW